MQSVTSNAVAQALGGFFKYKSVYVGDITFPSTCYQEINMGLSANDVIISAKVNL